MFSNALHLCHIEHFAKRCICFIRNLSLSPLRTLLQHEKKRNGQKTLLKHKYKQLFIYPYQMRVRATFSPPISLLFAHPKQARQKRQCGTVHVKARQNIVFTVYLLFGALVGDQQFYDYSLRIFLPFLILPFFLIKI